MSRDPVADTPVVLKGPMTPGRVFATWATATLAVWLAAWSATSLIGLPDWVLPWSLGIMVAWLAALGVTGYAQRTADPRVSWRWAWIGGGLAVAGFAAFVAAFMVTRAFGIGPAGSLIGAHRLSRQERLIITDFKSPATDSTLGVTIAEALRADLDQSTALRVVPRRTMNEMLGAMQKPASTFVDLDVGRELATSDGVNAVLDGDVVSLGERYVLSARLVSTDSREQLATFREEAADRSDLLPAIERVVKRLRSKVGESFKSIRESSTVDRVTTSSMEALSKYAAAVSVFDQTSDYRRAVPLLQQAVAIDSTFAMAWRRLALDFSAIGQRDSASRAAAMAYAHRERLSDVERWLTIATYHSVGPDVDDGRSLDAYENVLRRDSTNNLALTNAALILVRRREDDRALSYFLRAAAQDRATPNPVSWGNAVACSISAHGLDAADSIMHLWATRAPGQPERLLWQARLTTFGERDYDTGEQAYDSLRSRVAPGSTITDDALLDESTLMVLRGRLREGFRFRTDLRARQLEHGNRFLPIAEAGLDSALIIALVEQNGPAARAVLRRALDRAPLDSVPLVDRPYRQLLTVLASTGDSSGVAQARADLQRTSAAQGKTVDRPAREALADGQVEFAAGRFGSAVARFDEADRLRHPCVECVQASLFFAFDRLGQADSAIVAGEAYLKLNDLTDPLNDAVYRAGILQRLGELYEAKHLPYKAVPRYEEFVDLWKKADPELQPRVRDVSGRLERLRAEIVRKG